jgi:hypothetical protein
VSDFLPPVTGRLLGDISDYLEKLAAAGVATDAFAKGLPDKLGKQTTKIGDEGKKAGDAYAGKFSDTVSKKIQSALKALPDVKVTADSSDADRKLAELRTELLDLSKKRIGVDIDAAKAQAELARIKAEMAVLARSANIPLRYDLNAARTDLNAAEKFIKFTGVQLGDQLGAGLFGRLMGQGGSLATKLGTSISSSLDEGVLSALGNPATWIVAGPVVASAASQLGVMAGGAILTGIGLAGIGVGIAAQLHDPQVAAALSGLKTQVSGDLKGATTSFKQPLIDAVHIFGAEWQSLQPGLRSTFAALSPLVTQLASGAAGFVDQLVPGLEKAAIASTPLVQGLARYLPRLGTELGDLFSTIAAHEKEAEAGAHLLANTVDLVITVARGGIAAFSWLYDLARDSNITTGLMSSTATQLEKVGHAADVVWRSVGGASGVIFDLGRASGTASENTAKLNTQVNHLADFSNVTAARMNQLGLSTEYTAQSFDRAGRGIDGADTSAQKYLNTLAQAQHRADGTADSTERLGFYLDQSTHRADGAGDALARYGQFVAETQHHADGASTAVANFSNYMDMATHRADGFEQAGEGAAFYLDQLTHRADGAATSISKVADATDHATTSTHGWDDAAKLTLTQMRDLDSQIKATTISVSTIAGAMTDKLLNGMLGVANAELGVHDSLAQLSDSLKKNKTNFDENTAAGRANMQALLDDIAANQRLYDQNISSGMSAQDAAAKYDANTEALRKQLEKAHLTSAQIDNLIGQYAAVPDNVNTAIATHGLTDAINNLGNLLADLGHLDGSKYGFTVTEHYNVDYQSYRSGERNPNGQYGGIRHFDMGGIMPAGAAGVVHGGGPYMMFGEPGTGAATEGFLPQRGISQQRAAGLLSEMASWYGFGLVTPAMVAGMMAGAGSRTAQHNPSAGHGGQASAPGYVPIVVNLGSTQMAAVHAALIPVAQQMKYSTGTTGLS